jgi:peptide/nickel transport system substrate-binding protein
VAASSPSRCRQSAPLNNGRFCNADVDRWLEQSREVSDLAAGKASFEKIAGLTLEQSPIIYLYHPLIIIAHTTKLQGDTQLPDGLVRVVGVSLKP